MDSTIDRKESVNLKLEHLKKVPSLYNIEKLKKKHEQNLGDLKEI